MKMMVLAKLLVLLVGVCAAMFFRGANAQDEEEGEYEDKPSVPYECSDYPDFWTFYDQSLDFRVLPSMSCAGSDDLNGTFPSISSLADLVSSKKLLRLTLENSRAFYGQLTTELFQALKGLNVLNLRGLGLTGTIPNTLYMLSDKPVDDLDGLSIHEIDFSYNNLVGPFPTNFSTLQRLKKLSLWGNQLTGTLNASSFLDTTELHTLHVAFNKLHGQIPEILFEQRYLSEFESDKAPGYINYLHLNGNQFTYLPQSLTHWASNLTGEDPINPEVGIWLGGNDWTCDCHLLSWFGDWAFENAGKLKDWSDTKCNDKNTYAGLPIASLRRDLSSPCSFPRDVEVLDKTDDSILIEWSHPQEVYNYAVHFYVTATSEENPSIVIGPQYAGWSSHDEVHTRRHQHNITGLHSYTSYIINVYPAHKYYDGVVAAYGQINFNPETPNFCIMCGPDPYNPYCPDDCTDEFFVNAENFADMLEEHDDPTGPMGTWLGMVSNFPGPTATHTANEIRKRNREVYGAGSKGVVAKTDPSTPGTPPAHIHVSSQLDDGFVISWSAPEQPNGPLENLTYDIIVYESGTDEIVVEREGLSATLLPCPNLRFDKEYYVKMRARAPEEYYKDPLGPWSPPPYLKAKALDPCPLGEVPVSRSECLGGRCNRCEKCKPGYFNAELGAKVCDQCHPNFPRTRFEGASSNESCAIAAGSIYDKDRVPIDCPDNAECPVNAVGLTVEQIGLKAGFWRSDPLSSTLLPCILRNGPNGARSSFCPGVPAKPINDTHLDLLDVFENLTHLKWASAWESSEYCLEHHYGPLCESCEKGYAKRQFQCEECVGGTKGEEVTAFAFIIIAAVIGGLIVFFVNRSRVQTRMELDHMDDDPEDTELNPDGTPDQLNLTLNRSKDFLLFDTLEKREQKHSKKHHEQSLLRDQNKNKFERTLIRARRIFDDARSHITKDMQIKFKITFGSIQVAGAFINLFATAFPSLFLSVSKWTQALAFMVPFEVPVGCDFALSQFEMWIILSTLVPIIVVAVLYIVSKIYSRLHPKQKKYIDTIFLQSLLMITFMVYPGTSATIFRTFRCRELDDGSEMLVADPSVNCKSSQHTAFVVYSSFMIIIYPLGVVVLYSTLLRRNRKIFNKYKIQTEIRDEQSVMGTPFRETDIHPDFLLTTDEYGTMESLHFLWGSYKPRYYYFEVVMLITKLMETSIAPLVSATPILQILSVAVVTFIFLAIFAASRPFSTKQNSHLFNICQSCLFFMVVGALMSGQDFIVKSENKESSYEILSGILILLFFIQILTGTWMLIWSGFCVDNERFHKPLTRMRLLDPEYWLSKDVDFGNNKRSPTKSRPAGQSVGARAMLANVQFSERNLNGGALPMTSAVSLSQDDLDNPQNRASFGVLNEDENVPFTDYYQGDDLPMTTAIPITMAQPMGAASASAYDDNDQGPAIIATSSRHEKEVSEESGTSTVASTPARGAATRTPTPLGAGASASANGRDAKSDSMAASAQAQRPQPRAQQQQQPQRPHPQAQAHAHAHAQPQAQARAQAMSQSVVRPVAHSNATAASAPAPAPSRGAAAKPKRQYKKVPVNEALSNFRRSTTILQRKQAWDAMTLEEKMEYIQGCVNDM